MRIFKFALPLVAMICFGALGIPAEAATSKKSSSSSKSRSSEAGSRKKGASAKKSGKSRKATKSSSKSTKSKSRRADKGKQKAEKVAEVATANDWIDELPEVELPEVAGPAEDELLEPVADPAP